LAIRLIYAKYCDAKFKESKFRWYWDKEMFKVLLSFAGWNLWGNIASVLTGQGVNILLNIYFGPVVNAARGIAFQIKGAIISFVQNFQMALNPQIIKSFAINDITYMHQLTFQGSKFSFYLLLILSLPVLFETEFILNLWLKVVPDYTIVFTRLIILNILIDSISGPLMTAAQATGKIKLYQGVVGGVLLLNLPLSYVFLIFGYSPETTFIIGIFISIIALFIRLIILQKIIRLKIIDFFTSVIFKLLIVTIVSIIPPMLICSFLDESIMRIILVTFLSIFSSIITIYFLGLTVSERDYTIKILRKFQIRFF
jgi:O-antigen/teichoic acid export membrane protein